MARNRESRGLVRFSISNRTVSVLSERSTNSITACSSEFCTTVKPEMIKISSVTTIVCSTTGAIFRNVFLRLIGSRRNGNRIIAKAGIAKSKNQGFSKENSILLMVIPPPFC